jgi:hypothetical protein
MCAPNEPKTYLSQTGLLLVKTIGSQMDYYKYTEHLIKKKSTTAITTSPSNFVPSTDNFLRNFTKLFKQDALKPKDQQNLVIALLKAYVVKV